MKRQEIGIIDSGIGGFTVAKALHQVLPQEDILYLGDGANAPYGNRSEAQLLDCARYMVDFMNKSKVKLLLVACNTISCLASQYAHEIQCPVLYVVKSGAKGIAKSAHEKIGVISTVFTHKEQMYPRSILEIAPEKQVFSSGSVNLVRLIEENKGDKASREAIAQELHLVLDPMEREKIDALVLGCTHYPLALEVIQAEFPGLVLSDPATEMAEEAKVFLSDNKLLNPSGRLLTVYTTGDTALQAPHLARAGLCADGVYHYPPLALEEK